MATSRKASLADPTDEIDELEKKLRLVSKNQDTKVQIHSQILEDTRQTMEDVMQENKALREMKKHLEKESGFGEKTSHEREKDRLETKVHRMRKERDEVAFGIKLLGEKLKARKDKLVDIQRQSEPILTDESPLTQKIRVLENRLDKAMIKYNEAMSIKKTYESILKRLDGERLGFDNRLQAIESTLTAKHSDFVELQNLCHDAKFLKESAKNQMAQALQEFENEKIQKFKELEEKRKYVQARIEMTSTLSRREASRIKTGGDGDQLSSDQKLKANNIAQAFQSSGAEVSLDVEQDRLAKYEEVWRRLKEVTGVNDANEVIQKYLSSNDTSKDLKSMTQEAQQKIDNLVWKKSQLKVRLEETKYSQSTRIGSRRIADEFEQQLREAHANTERSRAHFERLAKVLIDTKAGIEHMVEKLRDISPEEYDEELYKADEQRQDDKTPSVDIDIESEEHSALVENSDNSEEENNDDGDNPEHIATITQAKLYHMKLETLVNEVGTAREEDTEVDSDSAPLPPSGSISTDHIRVSEHNIRIQLDEDEDAFDDDDDDDDDPTLEPSTRERIKQIAANEHTKHTRASRRKNRKARQ